MTAHAARRLNRLRLDVHDLRHVLRYGKVMKEGHGVFPETPRRYVLEGKSVERDALVCVVEVDGELVIVTAYRRRRSRKKAL